MSHKTSSSEDNTFTHSSDSSSQADNGLVFTHRSQSKTILNTAIVALGIGMCVFVSYANLGTGSLGLSLIFAGIALAIIGLIRLFFYCQETVFRMTRSRIKTIQAYFSMGDKESLLSSLNKSDFEHVIERCKNQVAAASVGQSNLRVDVQFSLDGVFTEVSILEFVPYQFVPVRPPFRRILNVE